MPNVDATVKAEPEQRERLLHAVNNWIRRQGDSRAAEEAAKFLCECGAPECYLTLEFTGKEYDNLPSMPSRRLLARTHMGLLDGNRVLVDEDRYVVLLPAE